MKRILTYTGLYLILSITFTACTYNISIAHTEGTATDVIDDNQSNTPNVSPTITATTPIPI